MDLHITIVLLLIFITGGLSRRCYVCEPEDKSDACEEKQVTCSDGFDKCFSSTSFYNTMNVKIKSCEEDCETRTIVLRGGVVSSTCCGTDLCNGTDGLYKGSFILLLSPLFFLILFH
nr:glycosylphosphatidylinositol-anchored high density lipoprotein-binding protein 1-like [Misgurnus anguillicaudatus]